MLRPLLLSPLLLLTRPAEAHIVSSRLGDFYGGALHPLTALPDIVLWLGLGLLAGLQPASRARWVVLVFPVGLLAGFALGLSTGWTQDRVGVDAAMMVALGFLVALAWRLPGPSLALLAFAVAVCRGAANASGVEPSTDATLFAAGLACAGYVLATIITALVEQFRAGGGGWQGIAVRAGGSWIAAVGLMVGGLSLVR